MPAAAQTRLFFTWLLLSGITLLAWWIGAHHGTGPLKPNAAVALGAITITGVKVRMILRDFMDVRNAPARLRYVTDAWLGMFVVAMLLAYFL